MEQKRILKLLSLKNYKPITPEWLEAHGFGRVYVSDIDTGIAIESWEEVHNKPFPALFDIIIYNDSIIFLEKELHRNQFCVVLQKHTYDDGDVWYSYNMYIQVDIAMGFAYVPCNYSEMTEYHFSLLYKSIRRKKL
jgi:hypothetical protein